MAGRLIRLRHPAACSGCGATLAPSTSAWWHADAKTARCETCGPGADPEVSGAPPTGAPPAEVRGGVAGGSAMRMAEDKRARREAGVRAAHPRLGGFLLAVSEEPQDIKNWKNGAVGERKLGAGLDGLASKGVVTLHDRLRTRTAGNIDHIAIGPTGVWVVDAKRYAGQVAKKDVGGWLRCDVRLYVGRRDCMKLVQAMSKQVGAVRDALGEEWAAVPVRPMLCFVDADWQWFAKPFELGGVLVTWPRAARERVSTPGPLPSETIERIAARLDQQLRPAS